jgi:hypothetical protein
MTDDASRTERGGFKVSKGTTKPWLKGVRTRCWVGGTVK